ncbi:MAG: fold-4 domain protein [Frankiales bacterium]|nr:fold-4 domain protein [Frankiales bacterium]
MPLRALDSPPPRVLDLADDSLLAWGTRVSEALEACALIDRESRVTALSAACASLLGLDPVASLGQLTTELLSLVDFTAEAAPVTDPELLSPTQRVLRTGCLARGLVRLRQEGNLQTYDVVAVPLVGGAGALAFVTAL